MIADAHTHIFPPKIVKDRDRFYKNEPAFRLLYENPKSRLISSEGLIEAMDKAKVDISVTFCFPWQSAELCRMCNDYVIEQGIKNPERIVPFAVLPCCSVDAALEEMERCAKAKIAGFGELSFYCSDAACDISNWQEEVIKTAARLGLPTMWHVTEDVGHDYPGKGGMNPKSAAGLIKNCQDNDVILAHWGGGLPFFELMPEIRDSCNRVYYDTAASPFLYDAKIYEAVVSVIGHERVLFGSDYPLIGPSRYIGQIRSTSLDEEQADAILGKNLLRLLGKVEP